MANLDMDALAAQVVGALGYYEWRSEEDVARIMPCEVSVDEIRFVLSDRIMRKHIPDGWQLVASVPDNKWCLRPEAKEFTLKEAEEKMEGILSDGEWHLEDELFSSVIGSGYVPHTLCEPTGRVREALHNLRTRRTLEGKDLYKGCYHGVEGSWATVWRMVP